MAEHAVVTGTSDSGALDSLVDSQAVGYAGDISPTQAYAYLEQYADAALVDVRTQPEWQFIGLPDLPSPHKTVLISWKNYPRFDPNELFAEQLQQAVPNQSTPIFFLCRSGGRSTDAAIAATQQGYHHCFNIAGGFEGELDGKAQRGSKACWKAELPWSQT